MTTTTPRLPSGASSSLHHGSSDAPSPRQVRRSRIVGASIVERNDPLFVTADVWRQIDGSIGGRPAESGGLLGADRATGVITHFIADPTARTTASMYAPNVAFLNAALDDLNRIGVRAAGIVHSHPAGMPYPSNADITYASRILDAIGDMREFAMPIVQTRPDVGRFEMHGFAVHRAGGNDQLVTRDVRVTQPLAVNDDHFARVASDVYDLDVLRRSRIVVVGAGGSASFCADMARIGVGQFVLIDADRIEASNVSTQHVRHSEVGTHKVREVARLIGEASAHAVTLGLHAWVEDTTSFFERLLFGSLPGVAAGPPEAVLLCAFTDDFYAQALVNRLALNYGVPTLAAGVYRGGHGLELRFSSPDTTPACVRCATGSRYRAYQRGYRNNVGSTGTPYSATVLLNALKQDLAVALLQGVDSQPLDDSRRSPHPGRATGAEFLASIGNRNLLQVRRTPWLRDELGLDVFEQVFGGADQARVLCNDTVWLPQDPECPETGFERCPDCGGYGDLRAVVGTFDDLHRLDWHLAPGRQRAIEAQLALGADAS